MRYWLVQCNPADWDLAQFVADGRALTQWSVQAQGKAMRPGDGLIIWKTSPNGGIIGLAEVLSSAEPYDPTSELETYWDPAQLGKQALRVRFRMVSPFGTVLVARDFLKASLEFGRAAVLRTPWAAGPTPISIDEWAYAEQLVGDGLLDKIDRTSWNLAPGEQLRRVAP